jgi:hypothetical protein
MVGTKAAIEMLLRLGPSRIEARVLKLSQRLHDGLEHLGVRVVSPWEKEMRSGVVSFTTGDTDASYKNLKENGFQVSLRPAGIRVSTDFITRRRRSTDASAATGFMGRGSLAPPECDAPPQAVDVAAQGVNLTVVGYVAFTNMNVLGQHALDTSTFLGQSAISDSTRALTKLGEDQEGVEDRVEHRGLARLV